MRSDKEISDVAGKSKYKKNKRRRNDESRRSDVAGKSKYKKSKRRRNDESRRRQQLSKRLHKYRHTPNKGKASVGKKKSDTLAKAYADELKKFVIKTAIEDGELDTGTLEMAAGMAKATAKSGAETARKPVLFVGGIVKRIIKKASKKAAGLLIKLLLKVVKAVLKLFIKVLGSIAVILGISIPIFVVIMAAGAVGILFGAFVIDTYGNAIMGARYIQEYRVSIEELYDDYDEVEFVGGDSAVDNNDDMLLIFMTRDDIEPEEAIENITERMLYYEKEEVEEEKITEIAGGTVNKKVMCETCKGDGIIEVESGYVPVCADCNNESGKVSFEVCSFCESVYVEKIFSSKCGDCTDGRNVVNVIYCDFCEGSGISYLDQTKPCDFCSGTGIDEIIYSDCTNAECEDGYIKSAGCENCGYSETYTEYCSSCKGTGSGEPVAGGTIECTNQECEDGYITVTESTGPSYETTTHTKTILKVYILTVDEWEDEYYIPDEDRYDDMTEMFEELGYHSGHGDTVCQYFINQEEQ